MTEEALSRNEHLLKLTRYAAGRYKRLVEYSRALENAQRRLICMIESGTVGRDVLMKEKDRIETMKRVLSSLRNDAETADRLLCEYKEKNDCKQA